MNFIINLLLIFVLAIFQVSILSFVPIWGITINIFFLIGIALAINQMDEYAPLWVGLGALFLDLLGNNQFGLNIISLGLVYLLVRWLSEKISILVDRQYLEGAWALIGIIIFEVTNLLILQFSGSIHNLFSYYFVIIKAIIIYLILFIPANLLIKYLRRRQINRPKINL